MAKNASKTRQSGEHGRQEKGNERAGINIRTKTLEESKTGILKMIASALESGQKDLGNQEGWRRVAKLLEEIRAEAIGLTRDRVNLSSPQAQVETTTRKERQLRTGKAMVTHRVGVVGVC